MQTETTTQRAVTRRRRSRVWAVLLWLAVVVGIAFVFLTFNWFISPATADPATVEQADAVVLFAGRNERLDTAIELMERGVAPNLVLPNGREVDGAEHLCDTSAYTVFCPPTDEDSTIGEARAIGRLAAEQGWSRLIAVTSVYHVQRATYLLDRCFDGALEAVTHGHDMDREDWTDYLVQEWAGFLGSVILQPSC